MNEFQLQKTILDEMRERWKDTRHKPITAKHHIIKRKKVFIEENPFFDTRKPEIEILEIEKTFVESEVDICYCKWCTAPMYAGDFCSLKCMRYFEEDQFKY